ncbi:MAG: arsenate reductase ArsC [Campylobacterales bacterium]
MAAKKKVLFVCIHNSARSQMAETFLNSLGGELFEAQSAGFEPGNMNPLVVEVMREIGYDLSNNETNSVFDFFKEGRRYNYVITVCDEGAAQRCPLFPGITQRINWSFEDPSSFEGTYEEKLAKTRVVRDAVKAKVEEFLSGVKSKEILENVPKE